MANSLLSQFIDKFSALATDAGGPGEFKYDGGPKPYIGKETGKATPTSAARVKNVKEEPKKVKAPSKPSEEKSEAPQPVQITEEQKQRIFGETPETKTKWTLENTPPGVFSGGKKQKIEDFADERGLNSLFSVEEENELEKMFPGIHDLAWEWKKQKMLSWEGKEDKERFPEIDRVFSAAQEEALKVQREWRAANLELRPPSKSKSMSTLLKEEKNLFSKEVNLNKDEKHAIGVYQEGSFDINKYLVTGILEEGAKGEREELLRKVIEHLPSAIDKFKAKEDVSLFRGVSHEEFNAEYVDSLLSSNPGDTISNKAFSSFSREKEVADRFSNKGLTLNLTLKKGQNGLPVNLALGSESTEYADLSEVVLNRDSRLKVESVDKEKKTVHLSLMDKKDATDSLAVDYTFIPEEHPRQKDPDWAGKPQEGGEAKSSEQPAEEPKSSEQSVEEPQPVQFTEEQKQRIFGEESTQQTEPSDFSEEKLQKIVEEQAKIVRTDENTPLGWYQGKRPPRPDEYKDTRTVSPVSSVEEENELEKIFPGIHDLVKKHMKAWESWIPNKNATKEDKENYEKVWAEFKPVKEAADKVLKIWEEAEKELRPEEKTKSLSSLIKEDKKLFSSESPLTENEKKAVAMYQSGSFDLNAFLITGNIEEGNEEGHENYEKYTIENLPSAINKFKAKEDVPLFRGIDSEFFSKEYVDSLLNSSPGDVISNKAFSSFSRNERGAKRFANKGLILNLTLKEGQKGLPVNLALGKKSEYGELAEVVLNKDSKFKIESVDKEKKRVNLSLMDEQSSTQEPETTYTHPTEEKSPVSNYFKSSPSEEDKKQLKDYTDSDYDGYKIGTQEVPIEDLKHAPGQTHIIKEHLEALNEGHNNPEVIKLPNGSLVVEDGHHRITAAKIQGKKTIKVDLYGHPDQASTEQPAEQPAEQPVEEPKQRIFGEKPPKRNIGPLPSNVPPDLSSSGVGPHGTSISVENLKKEFPDLEDKIDEYFRPRKFGAKEHTSNLFRLGESEEQLNALRTQLPSEYKELLRAKFSGYSEDKTSLKKADEAVFAKLDEWLKVYNERRQSFNYNKQFKEVLEKEAKMTKVDSSYDEKDSYQVAMYESGTSFSINEALITENSDKIKKYQFEIDRLTDVVNKFSASEDTSVYRGVKSAKNNPEYVSELLKSKPGDVVENKGFTSTTYDREIAEKYSKGKFGLLLKGKGALIAIDIKKGQKMLPTNLALTHRASYAKNSEIVLNRNSKMRIKSVNPKTREIHMELMDEQPSTQEPETTYTSLTGKEDQAKDSEPFDRSLLHRKVGYLDCLIETSKYDIRQGPGWMNVSPADYGFIKGYFGADGDEIDCYVGPNPDSDKVFIVNQSRLDSSKFDEHKVMLGYDSREEAIKDFLLGHSDGRKIYQDTKTLSMPRFLHWLEHGDLTKPI